MKEKLLVGIFAVGLLVTNFTFGENSVKIDNLTLKNISLIQANAGELVCDQQNAEECKIETFAWTFFSKGYLRFID